MANSFKQMIKSGIIKRRDSGMFIRLDDIHIDSAYDIRLDNEENRIKDERLFNYIIKGGVVPSLEVLPREPDGVEVAEGHRRTRMYRRCKEHGMPIEWIPISPFVGNDVDRTARIFTSNNQEKLSTLEQAIGIKKLLAFNLTPSEIVDHVHLSRTTVDKLIVIATANVDVQKLVASDLVSMDVAVDRVKELGSNAGEALKTDILKANKSGKSKVTKSMTAPQLSAGKARKLADCIFSKGINIDKKFIEIEITEELLKLYQAYNEVKKSTQDEESKPEVQQ